MRIKIIAGKSDSWGFSVEFYPSDFAITFLFLRWYLLIEKDYHA
jgi:hypothetical protein